MARGPQVSQLTLWCVHHCITPPCRQTAAKEEDEGGGEERERERLPIRQHRSVGGTTDQSTRLGGLILLIFVSRLTTKPSTRRRRRTKEEARSRSDTFPAGGGCFGFSQQGTAPVYLHIRVVRFWANFSNPFKLSIFPLYLLR